MSKWSASLRQVLFVCAVFSVMLLGGAALASVPTGTEGGSVGGKGAAEVGLNLGFESEGVGGATATSSTVAPWLEYGVTDAIDVYLEVPVTSWDDGVARESGLSDATLALKWRLFATEGVSLAFKPGVTLPTGDQDKGLGSGETNLFAVLAATFALDPVELSLNIGYSGNRNDAGEEEALYYLSAEADWTLSDRWTLAGEVRFDTSPDKTADDPLYILIGADYAVSEKLSIGVGYKSWVSDPAPDFGLVAGLALSL